MPDFNDVLLLTLKEHAILVIFKIFILPHLLFQVLFNESKQTLKTAY